MERRVGLCEGCRHVRVIESERGSRFYLCQAARLDAQLAKYPRLPVLRCPAHAPETAARPDVLTRPNLAEG